MFGRRNGLFPNASAENNGFQNYPVSLRTFAYVVQVMMVMSV